MIDKTLFIIICMYTFSFSLLGAQYMADAYGVTITAPDGTPIRATLLDVTDTTTVNTLTTNATCVTPDCNTEFILEPIIVGAKLAWNFFQILTGTLIFNILFLFGVPEIFIGGIAIVYSFLMINTVIAKIRGV
jgi:hypothetical protein